MKYKTFAYILIIFFLFTGIFISKKDYIKNIEDYGSNFTDHLKSSANSGKIHINNNWTATKTAGICTGEGTESNPYLLENLIIDAGGVGHAIHIENTTEYFKIENCTLLNSGVIFGDAGMRLDNVIRGQIINNTMYYNSHGMIIWSSLDLKIIRNRVLFNEYGVEIIFTNDSIFYLNTFMENDVYQFFFQWSTNQYNSLDMFSYKYNGSTFTNYLGNFWGGYTGSDDDGDGIGDTRYRVDSFVIENPDLIDYYPLIEPINAYSDIKKVDVFIPGLNVFNLLGIISMITILLVTINRKLVNKIK